MASMQGFSNLITNSGHNNPHNPAWLNSTDIIQSSESTLPVIDLTEADIKSQTAAVVAQSQRIVKQARKRKVTKKDTKSKCTVKKRKTIKRK